MSIDYYSDKRLTDSSSKGASLYFEGSGRLVRLEKRSMTIGRDRACDITLNASTVSRSHARIFTDGSSWYLEDLGSVNGMSVNGAQLASHETVKLYNNYSIVFADNLRAVFRDGGRGMSDGADTAFLHNRPVSSRTEPISPAANTAAPQHAQASRPAQSSSGGWRNPYYDDPEPKRCEPVPPMPQAPQAPQYATYTPDYRQERKKKIALRIIVPVLSVLVVGGIILAAVIHGSHSGKEQPKDDEPQATELITEDLTDDATGDVPDETPDAADKDAAPEDEALPTSEEENTGDSHRYIYGGMAEVDVDGVDGKQMLIIKSEDGRALSVACLTISAAVPGVDDGTVYEVYILYILASDSDASNRREKIWTRIGECTAKDGKIEGEFKLNDPNEVRTVFAVAIDPGNYEDLMINEETVVLPKTEQGDNK